MSAPRYEVGDRVIVNSALDFGNVTSVRPGHPGHRYLIEMPDGQELIREEYELSGDSGDKTSTEDKKDVDRTDVHSWIATVYDHGTLPQRMRLAADTLEDATQRHHTEGGVVATPEFVEWSPANLRTMADYFERQDNERKEMIEDLARDMCCIDNPDYFWTDENRAQLCEEYRKTAKILIENGWLKKSNETP